MNPPPPPPPPPPPHGSNTGQRHGLPEGNYDIFIVPPHSSGGGFVYFPSLQTNRNSFLAGVACTLLVVVIWTIVLPVLREWTSAIMAGGGVSVVLMMLAVGVAGWAWGKTQTEGGWGDRGSGGTSRAHHSGHTNAGPPPTFAPNTGPSTAYPQGPGPTPGFTPASGTAPNYGFGTGSTPGYQPGETPMPGPPPTFESRAPPAWQRSNPGATKGATNAGSAKSDWEKAKENTRRQEEIRKKLDDARKKREEAEKERVKQREKDARERELREARERREKEASRPASPSKNHRHPTAKTATDDASTYSYRPYDTQSRPAHKTNSASSVYSETSYAPSQSTNRTTPPPSHRGPYRNKDPDKIVIKAVYSFNNIFTKIPIAQLKSGVGSVTDGLILRITTEGLFIDDDVRGVPQREWDVKAWTLKLVEVWCPHLHALGASSGSFTASHTATGVCGKKWISKTPTNEESEGFLAKSLHACKPQTYPLRNQSDLCNSSQSGEHRGLHVLRASIRDPEGKKYVVVLQEEEGWKVAMGLQQLRRGSQVRALGVSGMPANETKAILENMGFIK